MPASILNDGSRFFPNVLQDEIFKQTGVLTHSEGRVSWGVVDPRRHVMTIWGKNVLDFVQAAVLRNASLISNAPFYRYSGGPKASAIFWYAVEAFLSGIGLGSATPEQVAAERTRLYKKYFTAESVEGYIYGDNEGISLPDSSRPRAHYFGRLQGRTFAHYRVGLGDPPRIPEVVGGLFRSVQDYAPIDGGVASQVGTWGLAPILSARKPMLEILRASGLDAALAEYERALEEGGEEYVPIGEEADDHMSGLIIALFGGGSPNRFSNLLSQVLVMDAVRVDGNSSILLAQGTTVLRGESMNGPKRTYNTHGYMFQPG